MSKEEKRSQMLSMIADWHQSGKSKKRYCTEKGINEATFYYWFWRSKENGAGSSRFIAIDKSTTAKFVSIYSPFGLSFGQGTVTNPKNRYLYNGKELQDGSGLYDYGARLYSLSRT